MFLRHGTLDLTEGSVILCQNVLLRFISENTILKVENNCQIHDVTNR